LGFLRDVKEVNIVGREELSYSRDFSYFFWSIDIDTTNAKTTMYRQQLSFCNAFVFYNWWEIRNFIKKPQLL